VGNTNQTFDVAISFINEDLETATRLRDELAEVFDVFIYTKKQEELAGTDGLESFRAVFRRQSRLIVVLLRERWGKTPWTRVEMEAITDRFLAAGSGFLFVIMMEDCAPPPWIPEKLIRFSLKDFGIEQAVGAIKARALEQGGVLHRPTPAFLAEQAQKRAQFASKRADLLRSEAGVRQAEEEAERLISLIRDRSEEACAAAPALEIAFGSGKLSAVMRVPSVSVSCAYRNRILNVLDDARLVVSEFRGIVLLPGESAYYLIQPKELVTTEFSPDLMEEHGWCWREANGRIHTSDEIATYFVESFFNLLNRQSAGELPSLDW